jgi:hypothetical protein
VGRKLRDGPDSQEVSGRRKEVQRLRKAEREGKLDAGVQALIAAKRKEAREDLARECVGALRRSVCVLEELVEATKPARGKRPEAGQIREVAGAVKILFDAHIVREALGVDSGEQPGTDRPSSSAEEAEGGETPPPDGSIN